MKPMSKTTTFLLLCVGFGLLWLVTSRGCEGQTLPTPAEGTFSLYSPNTAVGTVTFMGLGPECANVGTYDAKTKTCTFHFGFTTTAHVTCTPLEGKDGTQMITCTVPVTEARKP